MGEGKKRGREGGTEKVGQMERNGGRRKKLEEKNGKLMEHYFNSETLWDNIWP